MVLIWIIGIALFIIITPKNLKRKLILAFLVCQALKWLSGLLHLKFDLISFPTREFPNASDILLATEGFLYPLLCGFYIIYEPKNNFLIRVVYLSICISVLVLIDLMFVKFTKLIDYVNYAWYWTWLVFLGLFVITNVIYHWFFRNKLLFEPEKRISP
ncbi:CBO0543 family protein [Virgibacillus byunsanensis]|uniref:CBO0543 family protein n=1 Tax=Virgibacillus byunsanensis TaxID=570945 RepID=A0ABW3LQG5_9BACI